MDFVCSICGRVFLTERDYLYHLLTHPTAKEKERAVKNEVAYYKNYLLKNGAGNYKTVFFDYDDPKWKKISQACLKRIGECQICGAIENLEVHHRIPIKHNLSLAYDPQNLLVVCENCHKKIHEEYNEVLFNFAYYEGEFDYEDEEWKRCADCGAWFKGKSHWKYCWRCWRMYHEW